MIMVYVKWAKAAANCAPSALLVGYCLPPLKSDSVVFHQTVSYRISLYVRNVLLVPTSRSDAYMLSISCPPPLYICALAIFVGVGHLRTSVF